MLLFNVCMTHIFSYFDVWHCNYLLTTINYFCFIIYQIGGRSWDVHCGNGGPRGTVQHTGCIFQIKPLESLWRLAYNIDRDIYKTS